MACRLISGKYQAPVSNPMATHCQLDSREQTSIISKIFQFSLKKIHSKMSSVKCRPFCFGANELKYQYVYSRQKLGIYIYIYICIYIYILVQGVYTKQRGAISMTTPPLTVAPKIVTMTRYSYSPCANCAWQRWLSIMTKCQWHFYILYKHPPPWKPL